MSIQAQDLSESITRHKASIAVRTETPSVNSDQLLFSFAGIEISKWQSDKQNSANYVSSAAVNQVMQCFADSQGVAPKNRHRKRRHVGDRVFESKIYENEHDEAQD